MAPARTWGNWLSSGGGTRSSDVIVSANGLNSLALGTSELEGILEERPDRAMAILATLAERLGTIAVAADAQPGA